MHVHYMYNVKLMYRVLFSEVRFCVEQNVTYIIFRLSIIVYFNIKESAIKWKQKKIHLRSLYMFHWFNKMESKRKCALCGLKDTSVHEKKKKEKPSCRSLVYI